MWQLICLLLLFVITFTNLLGYFDTMSCFWDVYAIRFWAEYYRASNPDEWKPESSWEAGAKWVVQGQMSGLKHGTSVSGSSLRAFKRNGDGSLDVSSKVILEVSTLVKQLAMGFPSDYFEALYKEEGEEVVSAMVGNGWNVATAMFVMSPLGVLFAKHDYSIEPLVWVDPKQVGQNVLAEASSESES
tara:strand:- start:486 stop:1046 length:561 start_codon:yes stop_codon:yes gene_type:complete